MLKYTQAELVCQEKNATILKIIIDRENYYSYTWSMEYTIKRKPRVAKFRFKTKVKSVTQLAKALGVSRETVYNWIRGKSAPTPRNEQKIRELEL